jgi:hypothetical protein
MNKKAAIFGIKILLYIAYAFFILVLFLGTVSTMSSISGRMNRVPDNLEYQLLRDRAFASPECFAYQDMTGRSYDIIDINKFTNESLAYCMHLDNFPFDFRFTLHYYEEDYQYNPSTFTVEWMLDKKTETAYTTGWFGSDFIKSVTYPVLVRNHDDKTYLGEVEIAYQKSSRTYSDYEGTGGDDDNE